ncbi:MAG TPA: hypothetical protein ENK32_12860 [Anaerolineae bacterium]|nr:hypothetical protein [Anaerolineae bacterium]
MKADKGLTAVAAQEDKKLPAAALQNWVDQLYGQEKPQNVVDDLVAERRREAEQENRPIR